MPTLLEVMQGRLGIQEVPGGGNNPVIVGWFKAIGHPEVHDDETSWCACCMSSACLEAGLPMPPTNVNMMARSFLTWGVAVKLDDIQPGDVAVWPRNNSPWQGHVNLVEKVLASGKVQCIGGNQGGLVGGDAVTRAKARDPKEALGFRRPVPATIPALREAGSTEVKRGDSIQNGGILVTAVPTAIAVAHQVLGPPAAPEFTSLPESLTFWQSVLEGAYAVANLVLAHPWLAGTVILGLLCLWTGHRLKAARLAKHEAGMPLSVEVAKLGSA